MPQSLSCLLIHIVFTTKSSFAILFLESVWQAARPSNHNKGGATEASIACTRVDVKWLDQDYHLSHAEGSSLSTLRRFPFPDLWLLSATATAAANPGLSGVRNGTQTSSYPVSLCDRRQLFIPQRSVPYSTSCQGRILSPTAFPSPARDPSARERLLCPPGQGHVACPRLSSCRQSQPRCGPVPEC